MHARRPEDGPVPEPGRITVRDRTGHIHHSGVVTSAPGLYILGMPVLRTRASTYIHGAAADSRALASHLHSYLGSRHR